jgi:hypothetical protein
MGDLVTTADLETAGKLVPVRGPVMKINIFSGS